MTSSVLLGTTLELNQSPYTLLLGTSWGQWSAITSTTSSLFLDGAVVSGEATGNREILLRVKVEALTRAALITACEALVSAANEPSNTLTFTPETGPSIVYEVFRASKVEAIGNTDVALFRAYELHFPALPFARSASREMAGALVPGTSLSLIFDPMDAAFTGVVMDQQTYDLAIPTFGKVPCTRPNILTSHAIMALVTNAAMVGALTAVTNCTLGTASVTNNYGTRTAVTMAATAGGLVEARSTAAWAIGTADVITVAVNLSGPGPSWNVGPPSFLVGIEWLDSSNATVRIDWGTPYVKPLAVYASMMAETPTYWTCAPKPPTATQVRVRLRIPTATTGQAAYVVDLLAIPTLTTDTTTAAFIQPSHKHDGVNALMATAPSRGTYYYKTLPATLDISAAAALTFWIFLYGMPSALGDTVNLSIRLFDNAGKWSRFSMNPPYSIMGWLQCLTLLASPVMSSAAGAADLTHIVAYDLEFINWHGHAGNSVMFDQFTVSPAPAPYLSSRGTVLTLDPILGSARTPAAVVVASPATLMSDWLVATVDATIGSPLLSVTTSAAAVAAPAGYDGVYSVIAALFPAPGTAPTTPTCTIVQQVAGVTVATRVLAGTVRPGNHYTDFGAVELPLVATTPENPTVSYTFTLAPTLTAWVDLLVIDVSASLTWVDNLSTPQNLGWIDEPDITTGLGRVWVGNVINRTDGRATTNPPTMSRPFQVVAPTTRLLVYSTATAPNVLLTYYPRWLVEPS